MENKKGNVAVIAIIIVIVAISAGVIGWMFATKTQAPVQQVMTPAQQSASVSQIRSAAPTSSAKTPTAATDETANQQTYTNTQYGFNLKIPADWKGYTAKCARVAKTDIGMQTCYFNLPKYDGVFSVTIYTKSQWTQQQNEGMSNEEVLGQNATYVYTFSQGALLAGGNTPVDDETLAAQLKEVESIKKSFTLTQ